MTIVTVPPGLDHQVTYKFTDLFKFRTIAELPANKMQFAKVLNGVGPHTCSINVEDKGIRNADWARATAENRSALWIDVDGVLVYGGRNIGRTHSLSTGILTVTGSDACGYLAQRLQAQDYTAYTDPEGHHWATIPGAPGVRIAYYLLTQALAKEFSIPINVTASGITPEEFWITLSIPEEQEQTLASLLSQIQGMGYDTGIDYANDVSYVNGRPTTTITLSYPRRGVAGSRKSLVVEASQILDWEWDGDGSGQGNRIVELAGATAFRTYAVVWKKAWEEGYPLLELVQSHSALAPSGVDSKVLEAYAAGDLSMLAYPLTAPVITLPMFGTPSITELSVGEEIELRVPVGAGDLPSNNPLFPDGLQYYFRMARIEGEITDEGIPLMKLALNTPPGRFPVPPPEPSSGKPVGGGGKWEEKEKEREEEEHEEEEEKLLGTGSFSFVFTRLEAPAPVFYNVNLIGAEEGEEGILMVEGSIKTEVEAPPEREGGQGKYTAHLATLTPLPEGTKRLKFTITSGPTSVTFVYDPETNTLKMPGTGAKPSKELIPCTISGTYEAFG